MSLIAGMPSTSLTDVAKLRLEVISFFLVIFLLSAVMIRWVWNGLARDFPRLPRMSFLRALGVVGVWGALFILVLTMISGARELMTPGAWKKDGLTYKLAEPESPAAPPGPTVADRRQKLDALYVVLLKHSSTTAGALPSARDTAPHWQTPHASGMPYLYRTSLKLDAKPPALLAAEPSIFSDQPLGLFTNGEVRPVTAAELAAAFVEGAKP